ncbi:hypothetical protein FGO68_gene9018 [Halteria grandinella]|uniref:Uncharacterized protein n=1 Tax=Halteria grandinella TaxID=5974 RepID=A0A8J8P404_HALGN|nr:hypothetical protein FGO68_gene9018 [Halteria grandinella]
MTIKEVNLQLNAKAIQRLPKRQQNYYILLEVKRIVQHIEVTEGDYYDLRETTALKQGETTYAYIPDILSSETIRFVQSFSTNVFNFQIFILPSNMILKLLVQVSYFSHVFSMGAVNFMWSLLESIRKLTALAIISIRLPTLTTIINRSLLQFSQIDILPSDSIEEYFLTFDDASDTSLGSSFEGAGFGSMNALRNLGSSFIYIILTFYYYSFILTLSIFVTAGLRTIIKESKSELFWTVPLRMIIQQYFIYTLSALINLSQLRYNTSADQLASVTSIFLMIIVIGAPPLFAYIIFMKESIENFQERFGTLTETVTEAGRYSVPIDLVHALLTILIQIYLRDAPAIQINSTYLLSLLKQAYIVSVRPYQRPLDNINAIINELLSSCYLLLFMFFTEANENTDILHYCDILLISIACLFAMINLSVYCVSALGPLIRRLIRCASRRLFKHTDLHKAIKKKLGLKYKTSHSPSVKLNARLSNIRVSFQKKGSSSSLVKTKVADKKHNVVEKEFAIRKHSKANEKDLNFKQALEVQPTANKQQVINARQRKNSIISSKSGISKETSNSIRLNADENIGNYCYRIDDLQVVINGQSQLSYTDFVIKDREILSQHNSLQELC